MASVSFRGATCVYPGASEPAVDALDLEIVDGEFMVLVGPSGCGKSTSLRMLAGLEEVTDGHIRIGDRDVTHLPPHARDTAMGLQTHPDRGPPRHAPPAEGAGHRDGVPELRALPTHERRREHGVLAEDGEGRQGGADAARPGGREAPRPRAVPRPQAEGALRWPATAGRDGTGDRPSAAGLLHGRAAVEPRCEAAGLHPHPDRGPAATARRHHRLRDP